MTRHLLPALCLTVAAAGACAQATDAAADHDALRQLKTDLEKVVSTRDFDAARALFHQPFMATVITQDSFTDMGALKRYYDSLFSREMLRMKSVSIKTDADELSTLHTGTVALTRGSTAERYELADGRAFDMKGRWTAVSIKEPDGKWKLLGIHMGTNFLDNPVLAAIERSILWIGLAAGAAGLVAGFVGGWWFGRGRRRAAA